MDSYALAVVDTFPQGRLRLTPIAHQEAFRCGDGIKFWGLYYLSIDTQPSQVRGPHSRNVPYRFCTSALVGDRGVNKRKLTSPAAVMHTRLIRKHSFDAAVLGCRA